MKKEISSIDVEYSRVLETEKKNLSRIFLVSVIGLISGVALFVILSYFHIKYSFVFGLIGGVFIVPLKVYADGDIPLIHKLAAALNDGRLLEISEKQVESGRIVYVFTFENECHEVINESLFLERIIKTDVEKPHILLDKRRIYLPYGQSHI